MFEIGTDGPGVIVVGVDGTDSSWRAASYAAGLARRQRARLALVYIRPVAAMLAVSGLGLTGLGAELADTTDEIARDIEAEARAAAERLGESSRISWEFRTAVGDPFTGLAQAADELRADAVVVGASEQAGHRVLGSIAVRLVNAARWPVTVVP